jgi:anti-anti-sigma factor
MVDPGRLAVRGKAGDLLKTAGSFDIEQTHYGTEVLVVSFAGELDLAVLETAKETLGAALVDPSPLVVLDLTELELLGTCGVALFHALARERTTPDSLRILPSRHPGVNRVLDLTDLGSVIPIVSG